MDPLVYNEIRLKFGVMIEVLQGVRIFGITKLDDYPEIIEEFRIVMSETNQFRQSFLSNGFYIHRLMNIFLEDVKITSSEHDTRSTLKSGERAMFLKA